MFDVDPNDDVQSESCPLCKEGGVFCDGETGEWICENCDHNFSRPAQGDTNG